MQRDKGLNPEPPRTTTEYSNESKANEDSLIFRLGQLLKASEDPSTRTSDKLLSNSESPSEHTTKDSGNSTQMQSHKPTQSDNLDDENVTRASQEDELYTNILPISTRTNDDDISSEETSSTASLYSSQDTTGEPLAHPTFSAIKQAHLRAVLSQSSFDQKVSLNIIDNYTIDKGRPEPQINDLIVNISRYDANTEDCITSSPHEITYAIMNAFQRFNHPVFKNFVDGINELIIKGRTPSPMELRDFSGQIYDAWLDLISLDLIWLDLIEG